MSVINIPVSKAGQTVTVQVETNNIPEEVFKYALALGLKTILGRGMSKITKATAGAAEVVKETVEANVQAVYEGKVRMTGGVKPKGVSGAENTEAMRLARAAVKDMIKAAGGKVSHYDAKEITKAAKELVSADPSYLEQAKANIAARTAAPKVAIDVTKLAVNAKRVADAEAKKAEAKEKRAKEKATTPISAKQAGKVAARKPATRPAAH